MHDINIPQWVIDRVITKRGAEHVFTDLDPAKTALVAIDMQNAPVRGLHQFGDVMPTDMVVDLLG